MPRKSRRGLTISMCETCGFIQGNVSTDLRTAKDSAPTDYLSCDADYAAFRVGKAQMLQAHETFLSKELSSSSGSPVVLDVAAGWGDFGRYVVLNHPNCTLKLEEHSLEMFEHISRWAEPLPKVTVSMHVKSKDRPRNTFDFIYSTHSLEHFGNPREAMRGLADALKDDGKIFVEVPDVQSVDLDMIVEDYFYDEHLSYFSEETLQILGTNAGLTIQNFEKHGGSLTATFKKQNSAHRTVGWSDSRKVDFLGYSDCLAANRLALSKKVDTLQARFDKANGQIVVVGCGRRFDAFRVYGGLSLSDVDYFVDSYLSRSARKFHSRPLYSLDDLPDLQLQDPLFVCFASSSVDQIRNVLSRYGFDHGQVAFL